MMYSKELANSVLSICEKRKLSYEAASELCGISPRYFGSIARGQTTISISTLEKISKGFGETPNGLLGITPLDKESQMQVIHFRTEAYALGRCTIFPVCPRCCGCIDREYQAYCSQCGQRLGWNAFSRATLYPKT